MRFWFDLAVVAALTASVYTTSIPAVGNVNDNCPYFCIHDSACKKCWIGHKCVSMSSLRPVFNHMTHRRGRSSLDALLQVELVSAGKEEGL
jgi:hypothetical protein